jgi:hypothetical protein
MRIIAESIVVRANAHNPSILNPLFLKSEGIVPVDWDTVDGPICTPPLSIVKFNSGVEFLVDSQILQVSQNTEPIIRSEYDVPSCVARYISVLPHVPYTAVGINFDALVGCQNPEQFLIETFLKTGKWNDGNQLLLALSVRLVYKRENWRLTISLEPSQRLDTFGLSQSISITANFHVDIPGIDRVKETNHAVMEFSAQRTYFKELISNIISIGD